MKLSLLFLILVSTQAMGWTILSNSLRGWDTKTLTVGVNTDNCTIPEEDILAVIDTAINAWNGIPNADITIARADSATTAAQIAAGTATDAPVIACDPAYGTTFSPALAAVSPGVTVQVIPNSAGNIVHAGMLLNAQVGAGGNIANFTDGQIAIVVAHEMGHALGLGHSSDENALMYYSISGKSEAVITEDDMDGMSFLYPRNELDGQPFGCAAVHSSKPVKRSELLQAMGLILLISFGTMFIGRKFFKPGRPL